MKFIFITLMLDVIGFGVVIPVLPDLIKEFRQGDIASASLYVGLLATLYSLMQFLFAPLIGSLSDRYGRRPVILGSLFGSGLDYFLFAMAPNLGLLFVARIISGITGANFAAATAYIADVSPPEKRAANFGLVGAAFGLGFILGPALGGWLGEYGPRVPFIVAGTLTLLNWLYGYFVLPESLAPENRRQFSWSRSNPVGALMHLRQHPIAVGLAGTYFLFHLAHQVYPSIWVLYTNYRYNWSSGDVGLSLALVGLTAAFVQAVLTRFVVERFGELKTAAIGLIISSVAYAAYGLATHGWMLYAIIAVGSFAGVAGPAIQGLISRSVGADEQGGLQGSLTSLASVAGILGPPIFSGLFAMFIAEDAPAKIPGAPFFCSSVLMIVSLILAIRSFRNAKAKSG